jgi:hypothetical protein
MKRLFYLTAVILASVWCCAASTCTSATLADYIALGSGGCSIGADTLSNFQVASGITGATPITPADVSISASASGLNLNLTISVDQTASANTQLEALFSYQLSGASFTGESSTLSGASETGDGAVTDVENICAGGMFAPGMPTGCTGLAASLLTLDGVQNQNSTNFPAHGFFDVFVDLTLDGGLAGSASGATVNDTYSGVPEPFSFSLTILGLALGIGAQLQRSRRGRLG